MSSLRGKFVVFEGGEGCGKSTQAKILHHRLEAEGYTVLSVRDPGTTKIGEMVRGILLNPENREMNMRCEMLLYMAARAQMMAELIGPALAAGEVVLSDRFVSSTLAYQLGGDGLSYEEIKGVGEVAIGGRWPDLTLVLDLPVERSQQQMKPKFSLFPEDPRAGAELDRIEQRPVSYHEQVRRNYLEQARREPEKYRVIRADRGIEEIARDVWAAVSGLGG